MVDMVDVDDVAKLMISTSMVNMDDVDDVAKLMMSKSMVDMVVDVAK